MNKKKRLIFCTYSSIYSSIVLDCLLKSNAIDVVGIVNSTRRFKKPYGPIRGALAGLHITGLRYASYLFAITALFSIFSKFGKLQSVQTLARKQRIPLWQTADINNKESIGFLRERNAEIILSAHFNQLFKPATVQICPYGAINIHPSLLPDYKGVDPVFYAMLREEEINGVTVHAIDSNFDTGNILQQRKVPLNFKQDLCSNNLRLFHEGAKCAARLLEPLGTESLHQGVPQTGGNYDSWPTRAAVRAFKRKGFKLLRLKRCFTLRE